MSFLGGVCMDDVLVFIEKKRKGFFSTSNELMKTVDRYMLIKEGDFRK